MRLSEPGARRRTPRAAGSKSPAHRHGAREVAGVVRVLGAEVDQHQLPGTALLVVLHVMEGAGVGPRGHDGLKGRPRERRRRNSCQISASISYSQTPGDEAQQASEGLAGDIHGLPDQVDLDGRFDGAQMVHDRRQPLIAVQRKNLAAPFSEPRVAVSTTPPALSAHWN